MSSPLTCLPSRPAVQTTNNRQTTVSFIFRPRSVVLALMLGLTTLSMTGCDRFGGDEEATAGGSAAAAQQMPPPVVNVVPVQFQSVPLTQTFSGRTVAYQTADVSPQTTGIIEEVMYREGSMVQKGQPLYRINSDDYKASATGSQAAVGQAKAQVGTAKAAYNSALANLASQEALAEQARVDVQRLEPLVGMQAVSKQAFDQAVTQYKTAQAAVANAKAAANQAQANIASSEAGVATAQAQLDASTTSLNRTIVTAPISGKTDLYQVQAGSLVSAGQATPLVTISKLNPIYVDISQSSSDLLKLKQEQANGTLQAGSTRVELVLEDGTTYPVSGRLSLAEAKVDEDTGSVTLRAQFPNDNYLLLPGMFVNAKLTQGIISNAVLLPQSAMIRTPQGDTQVYVVENGKIAVRPVVVEGTYQGDWVVTDGLTAGEQVVIQGGSKVKPEQAVDAKPYVPDASQTPSGQQSAQPSGQPKPLGQSSPSPTNRPATDSQTATTSKTNPDS